MRSIILLLSFSMLGCVVADEIVFDNIRIQALSPTLVRIEKKGPMGFEDRTTFMVVESGRKFKGIPISKLNESTDGTWLGTEHYKIHVQGTGKSGCSKVHTHTDALYAVRTSKPFVINATMESCCAACNAQEECNAWVWADKTKYQGTEKDDPPGANCWLLVSSGGSKSEEDRVMGYTGLNISITSPDGKNLLWSGSTGGQKDTCSNARTRTDALNPVRTSDPCVAHATQESCCAACNVQTDCNAWVFAGGPGSDEIKHEMIEENDPPGTNCWLLSSSGGTQTVGGRIFGEATNPGISSYLSWPSPLQTKGYAIKDYPRFYSPPWGPTPIPNGSHVDPALVNTNGYDFRNNINGDIYVFLLGTSLLDWQSSREEFIQLTGPTPLLPDFSWGTWFTWWHSYTEAEAKGEVQRWIDDKLPLDVWALDMNWRYTKNNQDRFYNHPNTDLFANFSEWFEYLQSKKLRTYFNDHPYPVDAQTSPKEVAFRWQGLSMWMERGLTYWWFDRNWGFSIPPPFVTVPDNHTGGVWEGLDNAVWGSHLYHTTVSVFDKNQRPANFPRPITLTKFAPGDQHPGLVQHEHPAHHRYPVWWTGDGVNLQASVESMVDNGVYDFKPYVHSDCGGDYRGSSGDLLRWTAHCVFGTILRFHGNQHQPWSYDSHTEDVIRSYLNIRYKLIPSLISAGQQATQTGFPIVARGDFFWPEHSPDSSSNLQYLHLNDTLVAPIYDTKNNETSREVWIPPGSWQDAWSGSSVSGPKTIKVTQPYERIPMWHRQGGLIVTTSEPSLRVDDQDWSTLILEAFPCTTSHITHRTVYNLGNAARTNIVMHSDGTGFLHLNISSAEDYISRGWTLRLHLQPGQHVVSAFIDGIKIPNISHLKPSTLYEAHQFFPFGGVGTAPAPNAGPIAEIFLKSSSSARTILVKMK